MKPNLHIIGSEEKISFPTLSADKVSAKVDTGADTSSVWCSRVKRLDDGIECVFFGPGSPHFTGKKMVFKDGDFKVSRVHNSFGHNQRRYKVKIPVIIGGRRILASFTLADRSTKKYPVLIGRRLLARKFLVDVTQVPARVGKRFRKLEGAVE
jgi:hypothetical protein